MQCNMCRLAADSNFWKSQRIKVSEVERAGYDSEGSDYEPGEEKNEKFARSVTQRE